MPIIYRSVKGIELTSDEVDGNFQFLDENKQDVLTFDSVPTNGSSNPVTSDGIYDFVNSAVSSIDLTPYLKHDGTVTVTGSFNWGGFNIENISTLSNGSDSIGLTGSQLTLSTPQLYLASNSNDFAVFSSLASGVSRLFFNNWANGSTGNYIQTQYSVRNSANTTYPALTISSRLSNITNPNETSEVMFGTYYNGSNIVPLSILGNTIGIKSSSYNAFIKSDNLTTDRTFQFPDESGTFALTSDLLGFGSGTVTSVALSGSEFSFTGSPITTSGTIGITIGTGAIANSKLANSSLTVNGSSISLGGSATITANTTNDLTVDNSSLQLNSGTTFNGSSTKTISVKAGGITNAMLAGSISDSNLATSYIKADGTRSLTADWGVGTFSITGIKSFAISGTAGAGYGEFIAQSSGASAPSVAGFRLFSGSTGNLSWMRNDGGTDVFRRTFASTLTANRTYTWQDNSYTVAGLDIAQSFTAQQTFTGSSTQMASVSLLDTTYKSALDVFAANTLRLANGFTTLVSPAIISITNSTAATSTSTGALQIAGGGSVVGDWWIGGSLRLAGTNANILNSNGNITLNTQGGNIPGTGYGISLIANSNITNSSGSVGVARVGGTLGFTTGTADGAALRFTTTINNTGGTPTMELIDVNPTVTNVNTGAILYGVRSRLAASPTGGGTAWNILIKADSGTTASSYIDGSLGLFATPSFGSGVGVMFIGNASTNPSTNPTGGGVLYVEAGALKFRGSSGTVTTIANA